MALSARTTSLTAQSAWLIAGRLLGFSFAFVTPLVLVRVLDQAAFGTYKQFFLVAGTLLSVLPLGLDASLFYFIPRDPQRAGNYLRQTVVVLLTFGPLVAGGLFLARSWLAEVLNSPTVVTLVPWLGAYLVFELVGHLLERVVVIEKQARLAAVVLASSDLLRAAFLVVPALLTRDLVWVGIGAAAYGAVRFLGLTAWAVWQYRDRLARDRVVFRFDEQVQYALPFGLGGVLHQGVTTFHAFYVAATFSPALYAIYAVACQQIAPVNIFFRSLFEVTLVRMTEYSKVGAVPAMQELWRRLIARQAALVVPLVVALSLLADAFVEAAFTRAYLDAVPIFRIYLLLMPLTMLNDHAVLRACAQTRYILLANTTAMGASLVLVPVLTLSLGLQGAALGFLGGVTVMKVLGLLRIGRLLRLSVADVLPWGSLARVLVVSAVAAGIVHPLAAALASPYLRFFGAGAAFWAVYFALAWLTDVLGPDEKNLILGLGRRTRLALGASR